MVSAIIYVGLSIFGGYTIFSWFRSRVPPGLQLPPGPRRRFLIGNLLDIPMKREWLTFERWAKTYGDLVYINALGNSIVYVNSYELARELFDKRGNIYSNRPRSTVLHDLLKLDWTFIVLPYGEVWRRYRAFFNHFFSPGAVGDYKEIQQKHTKIFLERIHQSPDRFREHLRFILGAIVLEISYGIQVRAEDDKFLTNAERTTTEIGRAGIPGTYMADIFPILRYVPEWFPGAKFKHVLSALRKQTEEMVNAPIKEVEESMKQGTALPSIASSLIEQFESDSNRPSDYEDLIKHVPGTTYFAAIDTMDCTILQFFLAMILHPEVQTKAQAELDSVIGHDTLPSLSDRDNLPYIQAVFHETIRWNTPTPIGVPHILETDDVVGKYFIPKGTIVIGNTWTLLRSTSVYGKDAHKFRPERFIEDEAPVPDFAFGYGRRACPGRYFAENTVFLLIASILHTFSVLPAQGKDGPEYPEEDFDSGIILRPKVLKCRIMPRTAATKLLDEIRLSN